VLDDVLPWLACPHCGGHLRRGGASLICSAGHTMNVARQGYVSLLGRDSRTDTADTAAMIAARERVAELFDPLIGEISAAADSLAPGEGPVLDLGSGPGSFLAAVLEALPGRFGIALDSSKFAARRAARIHPRVGAVVADIWDRLPVRDGSVALLLNVFAPRNGAEMARVMASGGRSIVVTPGPDHLEQLIGPFGMIGVDPDKEERVERSLEPLGGPAEIREFRWTMTAERAQVADLVAMGPSAGRLSPGALVEVLEGLSDLTPVTGSVRIRLA